MIVEDGRGISKALEAIYRSEGYEVVTKDSGGLYSRLISEKLID